MTIHPIQGAGVALYITPAELETRGLTVRELSAVQAGALARQACLEQLAAELPGAEILSEDSRVEKNARQLTLTLHLRVYADIAREVPCE